MRKALKAPMNADPAPMPADKGTGRSMATACANTQHPAAAIGVHLSAFIGAFEAVRRTKC
jgi:hypothetical protein